MSIVKGLVSTIIPVHNRARFLRDCVESVVRQGWRPIEIIIIDDGSTDETPATIRALMGDHADLIQAVSQPNGGPGRARETGRTLARGEFIQYLDSDDRLLPGKFEVQVEALRSARECGIAYGITELIDENGMVLESPYKWTGRRFDELFPALLVDRWWNTHTPLWRRSVCDAIGPWAARRMAEDWDYDARAAALRTRLVHSPMPLSQTRRHGGARLTDGEMTNEKLEAIAALLPILYEAACSAGASYDTPEMKHFARWAFAVSRQCARLGDRERARRLLAIAEVANGGASADMRFFRLAAGATGWPLAATLAEAVIRRFGRGPGARTMKQSWMRAEP